MTRIGTESTRTWSVEYVGRGPGIFENYQVEGLSCEVTDGGVLIFRDLDGVAHEVTSPSGWTRVWPA